MYKSADSVLPFTATAAAAAAVTASAVL